MSHYQSSKLLPTDVSIDQERHMHCILDEGLQELRKSTERGLSFRGTRGLSPLAKGNMLFESQTLNHQNSQTYIPLRNQNNTQISSAKYADNSLQSSHLVYNPISQQPSQTKNQSLRRLIEEVKQSSETINFKLNDQKKNPLLDSTSSNGVNMHQDLVQLQQRIMGLEQKIKEDNDSMRRTKVNKNERLKGIIKQTNVLRDTKASFSFNYEQSRDDRKQKQKRQEKQQKQDETGETDMRYYNSKDYINSEEEQQMKPIQQRKLKQRKSENSVNTDIDEDERELEQMTKNLNLTKRNLDTSKSSHRKSSGSQPRKLTSRSSNKKSSLSRGSYKSVQSDESLKKTSQEINKLKKQLQELNNKSRRSKSRETERQNPKQVTKVPKLQLNQSRSVSKKRNSRSQSFRSSSKKNLNQSSYKPANNTLYAINNLSMTQLQSSSYQNEKENYQKEVKYKKLLAAYQKIHQELDHTKLELRQERKNNQELISMVEKLGKKAQYKDLDTERLIESEQELKNMTESFQKSERIRREQKQLIMKLKNELEIARTRQLTLRDLQDQELDEQPVKLKQKTTRKKSKAREDKENMESARARKKAVQQ